MGALEQHIADAAASAAQSIFRQSGVIPDYSEGSLELVERALAEASSYRDDLPAEVIEGMVRDFGCYVLEVGRRRFGGRYAWLDESQEPVLISGEPDRHIALASWSKVRGRLLGDAGDNIPFHYFGYSERLANSPRGTRVLIA
jgi:hypothetical protein